jgi:hypothetical protein
VGVFDVIIKARSENESCPQGFPVSHIAMRLDSAFPPFNQFFDLPLTLQNFLKLSALHFDLPLPLVIENLQVGLAIRLHIQFRNVFLRPVVHIVLFRLSNEGKVPLDVTVGARSSGCLQANPVVHFNSATNHRRETFRGEKIDKLISRKLSASGWSFQKVSVWRSHERLLQV